MGLFGSARLRDKSLASPEQYQPMFSPDMPQTQPFDEQMRNIPRDLGSVMQTAPIKGPGAFGRGGMGWNIVGAIGDSLAEMGGYQGAFGQAQRLRQQQAHEEAQWTRRQDSELNRQIAVKQWEREHPAPPNNDTVNDYNFIAQQLGPDKAREYLSNRASGGFVGVDVQQPDGSVIRQFYPKSGVPSAGGASGPQPGHVEDGFRFKGGNPGDPNSWEQVGGAGQVGPRTFR